jgi:hypothetical protein
MVIDRDAPSPLDTIAHPDTIRARLSHLARERALLRDLLKLAERRQSLAPQERPSEKEGCLAS